MVNIVGAVMTIIGAALYYRRRLEVVGALMCVLGMVLMMNEGWAVWA